jgi:putative transferase (TIGR04331 family)
MSENLISNLNRENFKLTLKVENEFESILFKLIVKHIPKSYFENYCFYNKKKINFKWPNNPDVIFTSTSFFNDDFFKIWAGKKIDKKVPFVIYQHGGLYGQSKFSFPEYHEIKVSNYYLTWGWSKNKQTKVKPIGYIKKTIKRNKVLKDKILLVIHNAPRYTITIDSYPVGSQWIYYFEDILTFIERLPERIIKRLVVKLYPYDYGWDVAKRLKDRFPHLKISPKNITFDEHLKNTSLIICGWNSTTFLEGMVSNIPTLAFWNKKYFPLRISAQKEYKLLNKVNIFHNSPIDAAKHLIIIEDKIDLWWKKIDVVNAKNKFLLQYAMINDIPKMLTKFISSHINKH